MQKVRALSSLVVLTVLMAGCATGRTQRPTSQFVAPDPAATAAQRQSEDLARMQSQLSSQQSELDQQRAEMARLQAEKDALARNLEAQQARQKAIAEAKAAVQDEKYLK